MPTVTYTDTEKLLLDKVHHLGEIPSHQLESLADSYNTDYIDELWVAIELGRCPSTDNRTYILHTYYSKPEFDYYGAERIK
jgi:hypothetical protein